MLLNYIKIAFRTLKRKMVYTTINVLGLSAGLVCIIFIYNWVQDELSYDQHFPKKEQIYRVVAEVGVGGDQWHQSVTSLPMAPTMENTFPEVKAAVRFDKNDALVEKDNRQFVEDFIIFTDPEFFEVFDYHLISGNETSALSDPFKIVLTESIAKKYFGEEDPLGQFLKIYAYDTIGQGVDYEVTGVIADPPQNSHFTFNILGSISTIGSVKEGAMQNWGNNSYHSYILLEKGANPQGLEQKFPAFVDKYLGISNNSFSRFYLQPIESIHLNSNLLYEFKNNGKKEYIWIFSAIGIFIILLAAINYINLSTAFSMERARETGVRKVLGANQSQLINQHLIETLVLTTFSVILAGLMVEILKPFFYEISGKNHISIDHISLLLQLLMLAIPVGLVAGYFPARMLSKMKTICSLKGRIAGSSYGGLRNILVTFQFAITLLILVGLVVVSLQIDFVMSKDLGYEKENLMVLRVVSEEVNSGYETFKDEMIKNPGVSNMAVSSSMIANGLGNGTGTVQHEDGENQYVKLYRLPVGYNYINTYGMEVIAGRDFSRKIASDSTEAFIINEQAASAFGWNPDEAIGKELSFSGRKGQIIGVTKDFHFNSLKHEIQPLCMFLRENFSRITIRGENSHSLVAAVEETWKKHFPTALFDYTFQDQALFWSYEEEKRFSNIINVFSILSIIIAFLGLFGLVSYTVSRKTKEIGIRKVLGASVTEILLLISVKFLRLILLAAFIAFPVAWWVMSGWLNNFPYHLNMNIWIFISVGFVIMFLSLAIISTQTIKAALVNPAETLNVD